MAHGGRGFARTCFYYQSIKIRVHLLSLRRPRANTRFEDIYAGHCKVLTMPIIHTL